MIERAVLNKLMWKNNNQMSRKNNKSVLNLIGKKIIILNQ